MANSHRRNVLVTSCLKTPVDPNTKAPLASYERGRASASGRLDNRDYEKELEYQDSESDFCEEDCVGKTSPHMRNGYTRGRPDLSEILFSNEEYYSKLEELKKTHLSTMAKLENMFPKVLEQRKKAEEEEQRWRDEQKQREKKLQRLVLKRAQANDTHQALSQTYQGKLNEFRKQDLQRKKEYKQEIRSMCERVEGRPLLLEQVAQRIARQAAEKRYIEALHGSDVTEDFLSSKVGKSASDRKASASSDSKQSNQEDADYKPVRFRKIFLDDEDIDDPAESKGRKEEESDMASVNQDDEDHYPDDYHGSDCSYSDGSFSEDVENYSDNSEHDADLRQQKVGE
uniref:Protein FAM161A n=2 Tax=Nothobranchius korthausae TaxID=1143690 RepID=A0A1A8FEH7_9TELE